MWTTANCIPKDCGSTPTILNGAYTFSNKINTTYASLANVTCDAGYESNVSQIMCQTNATWTKANCFPKDCGPLSKPDNGDVVLNAGTKYEAVANYSCNDGFQLVGDTSRICKNTGTWSGVQPTCAKKDCGSTPAILNGAYTLLSKTNTTYATLANVTCDAGYESNVSQIMCQTNATWTKANCFPKDCGPLSKPDNGDVVLNAGTKYEAVANYSCNDGFQLVGDTYRICKNTGTWSGVQPTCAKKDCGPLSKPDNGDVVLNAGTKYIAVANFSCNDGFQLVGDTSRICQHTGNWSGVQPTCAKKESPKVVCTAQTDSHGVDWGEVLAGDMRVKSCEAGFTGNVTRKCLEDGKWQLPNYNCIRTAVDNVLIAVDSLQANATTSDVVDALNRIANVTNQERQTNASSLLTNAEITSLSSSLETIATLVEEKGLVTPDVSKNFFKCASNLIDDKNQESWQSMQESKSNGGEKVLSAVDILGEALRNKIQNGTDEFSSSTTIIEPNVAIEVKKVKMQDIEFPTANFTTGRPKDDWVKDSQSSIRLDAEALGNTDVVWTAIMYKDMSDILPTSSEDITSSMSRTVLNGPVLSLSIFPKVGNLDPPVTIVFKHAQTNLSSALCGYWKFGSANQTGKWASDGCRVRESNNSFTVCECDHLTNFAVLMSPFVEADSESIPLRVVSIVGIGLSMLCLLITILIHVCLWRYLKGERAVLLLNLSIALLSSYIIFLAGVDRTESTAFCAVVAALL
ncbi:adhesion G protein-coupled receptor B3-like [Dreissena polymorpha]|uniref:adhesion G protein-coupled receptor B3-like n=1 Tax=Dreissena polymorpha TaxID=45954 RepID=UPI002264663A|nr:adhesion G protein-coupled receptor B3-like [Dreissena polymorpha]